MTNSDTFFNVLLQQPLFQGLSRSDLTDIVSAAKMDFRKFNAGSNFYTESSRCVEIMFLLNGKISVQHTQNRRVIFSENWTPPAAIGISSIFGINQSYNCNYHAQTDIQTLSIEKDFITRQLLSYDIFRYNLLGMLCTRVQRTERMLWETPASPLLQRFLQICKRNFIRPYGEKEIIGTMSDLAVYVDATRLNLSRILNRLKDNGLLRLDRKRIYIPNFESLILYAQENEE